MIPQFADPWFLGLALVVVPIIWLYIRRNRRGFPSVSFPTTGWAQEIGSNRIKRWLRHLIFIFKIAAIILLAIALARPQSVSRGQEVETEGIDIVIALDISASMRARDFNPDRAEAAKQVAINFIEQREHDRIGIVLFAKHAFTQCPLTVDHAILKQMVENVEIGLVDPDNTAIGQALGVALNRLKESPSKSRVVILLTDGENNFGQPPTTLAEAAQALGVKVYTIGVGTRGTAPYPMKDPFGRTTYRQVQVNIDEDLLKEIATATGGKYYRAANDQKLKAIFDEIDQLEKIKIEVRAFRKYAELFYNWAYAALALLIFGWLAAVLILRSLV